ncbi:putative ankyrin repeat protein RF_0381 [Nasonia vitripennis]|uniref:Uncharacterized protein n=1 Tax=Nasonia vitripennis TaxID=7425 RepID=A0A7M7GEY8_NASVI|nr:putative ankyrin repeat protein RF_0381 [Nasonia vitripennis]XP_008210032.1 putative ankyrin repeat protein RF_0381 [Nasonia vitripennis]
MDQREDDIADENGNTALHCAISCQEFEIATQLIRFGVEVCARNNKHVTPLLLAIANRIPIGCLDKRITDFGKCARFSSCIKSYKFAIDARDEKRLVKVFALGNEILSGDDNRKLVKMLLNAGADVNAKSRYNCSPIHCAVYTDDLELVKILFDAGANINTQNKVGATALHAAVLCRNESMVRLLLNIGASVHAPYNGPCQTPLFWASMLNWDNSLEVIIRELLEAGSDLSEVFLSNLDRDSNVFHLSGDIWRTSFDFILMYGNINLVKLCIEKYNADLKLRGVGIMDESDALKFAAYNEDISVMNLMLEKGITKCTYGLTALHLASLWFRPQHVRQLIANGADVNVLVHDDYESYANYSPLALIVNNNTLSSDSTPVHHEALECKLDRPNAAEDRKKTIKLLLDCGANRNQKMNERTETDLDRAISNRSIDDEIDDAECLIIEHAVLVEARTNEKVFDEYNLKSINENPRSKEYYEMCQAELTAMKNSKIGGTLITYFSVLTKPLEVVARYFRNDKFVQEFEANYRSAYPAYAWRLKGKFEVARARQLKFERALFALNGLLKFTDPTFFTFETVLKYLTEEDFDSLIDLIPYDID